MKVFLFIFPSLVFAAGDGHHAGIDTLLWPVINFSVLFGFLFWKLKTPMSEYFKNLSKTTKAAMDDADAKSKEAKLKFEANQKKLDQLESEVDKINRAGDEEIRKFEDSFMADLKIKAENNLVDAGKRLELEKQVALNQLGEKVLGEIISQTKTNINSDTSNKSKAEKTVIERLG